MNFYPLKFYPILKERLWGGTKLGTLLGKSVQGDTVGESWELSGVSGDVSVVANGSHKGKSLTDLIQAYPEEVLGRSVLERFGTDFPILIKFIDAKRDLSIQLHPNDELAQKRHNSFGKTEMWYIMNAEDGANLIVGFNKDMNRESYTHHLENNSLLDVLNYETVEEGDTFFINTGKVHAIGAGILLAEIQQTSDVTYRIFDFNRKDKDGKLRELHTDLALDAIDYEKREDFRVQYERESNEINQMVDCPYFKTNYTELTADFEQDLSGRDSFTIYICVDGSATLENEQGSATLQKGETLLLPGVSGHVGIKTEGVKLLEVTV